MIGVSFRMWMLIVDICISMDLSHALPRCCFVRNTTVCSTTAKQALSFRAPRPSQISEEKRNTRGTNDNIADYYIRSANEVADDGTKYETQCLSASILTVTAEFLLSF